MSSCPAGVVCPAGATCVVDGSGYPFCKCAAGQAIINGVCAPTASWAEVGTNVVLYNAANYANTPTTLAPAVLRGAAPNSSAACVNLPAAFNGTIGSLRIMWNVNDGVADHLVCGKLFFWDKPNCCCSGSGYQIPGGNASGIIAVGRSISCQAAIATNTYPCATKTCPVNAACSVVNSAAVCTCNAGYSMVGGLCVGESAFLPLTSVVPNPCTGYTCPANSACSNVNGVATCTCSAGYQMVNGQCVVPNPCTGYTCPANSACSNVNGVATCTCSAGYQMVNGQCVVPDPCATANCPLNSVCSNVNGVASCTCSAGFQMVNGQCAALPPSDPCASTTCQANAACSVVNGAATCTCLPGFDPVNGACIAPDPCAGFSCPANSACSNVNGVATCTCSAGYQMTAGQCVAITDPCASTTCPAKATCSSVNGVATCVCAVGYTLVSAACQRTLQCSPVSHLFLPSPSTFVALSPLSPSPTRRFNTPFFLPCAPLCTPPLLTSLAPPHPISPGTSLPPNPPPSLPPVPLHSPPAADPCSLVTCPANCTCSSANGVAKCDCPDLCYGVKCPDVSTCTFMLGAPVCTCPAPYTRLIDNKCTSATLANSDYLDNQNAARAAVGAIPLVWNATLEADALAWATVLTNSTYNCGLSHGGNPGEGQNLAAGKPGGHFSSAEAVSWWVGEGKLYSLAAVTNGCSTGNFSDCGHYTQVIWNNTRTVGCAKASCGATADVWACNYYPAGNVIGQPPYVQDPCYRVACPSTAACTVRYGQPMCVCGAGQVLVNNATCQPDSCTTATITCPGNLVCDGSSGTAQCACPTRLVPVTNDSCIPPACVGAVCPAQATCAVDGSRYPFCQCPTGWYLGSNVCVQGTPAAVSATSLAIYNTASYTSTAPALGPTLVRTGLPVNSTRGSCVDIPGGIAAASLRVLWNVPDSTGAAKQSCRLVYFWTSTSCYGSATGYYRPAGDVTNFDTTSGNVALVKAVACAS
ncbi:unnamed protein product [Closterium sp. Naga37s-1]|nr:unnamed protein product [Closterium sp. Naga37s-1]